ncbi:MAG: DNA polymerase III subunit beta [Coriobacteriales bacterium]|jgi:DNA polymerase-3 subunit beta
MNFAIDKKELSTLTTLVHRAASSKSTVPVLSGLLINVSKDTGLTMTATDMEIGIKASTKSNLDIIEEGTVLVNAHYFADFIKLLPDSRIKVILNREKNKLSISYGRSTGFINIYQDYDYPDLMINNMDLKISLPQKALREALKKTSFASALTHFRQVFTGILFDVDDQNNLAIVASDTHRLALYKFIMAGDKILEPFNFIIPSRTVNELLRIIDDSDELIKIALSGNNAVFYNENVTVLSRVIEGQYPNYNQVIPSSFSTTVKTNTERLMSTLERARVMPTDDKLKIQHVQLKFKSDEILINTYSELVGEIEEIIEDFDIQGENEFLISFNTNYLLDVVKVLGAECENIQISFSGSLGPAMIKNPDREDYIYIIVPLRTS